MPEIAPESQRCPPHHWFIHEPTGDQPEYWECVRCKEIRGPSGKPPVVAKLRSGSTWTTEELLLSA